MLDPKGIITAQTELLYILYDMLIEECEIIFRRTQKTIYSVLKRVRAEPKHSRRIKMLGGRRLDQTLVILDILSNHYEPAKNFERDLYGVLSRYFDWIAMQRECQMRRIIIMRLIGECDKMHILVQVRQELGALFNRQQPQTFVGECPFRKEINTILAIVPTILANARTARTARHGL